MSETEPETTEPTEPDIPFEEPAPDETSTPDETPDETPTGPETPGEQPIAEDQAQPVTEKEIEKVYKALAKLRETTASRVGAIMGDDAVALQPCPVCGDEIPGHVWQVPFEDSIEPIYAKFRTWLGIAQPRKLKRHPDFQTCPDCDGEGFIDTGGHRENYMEATCPRCQGKSYLSGHEVQSPAPSQVTGPTATEPVVISNGDPLPSLTLQQAKEQGWMVAPPLVFEQAGAAG